MSWLQKALQDFWLQKAPNLVTRTFSCSSINSFILQKKRKLRSVQSCFLFQICLDSILSLSLKVFFLIWISNKRWISQHKVLRVSNWNYPHLGKLKLFKEISPKICCLFGTLAVNYFTFTAIHSADKFSIEQQILGLSYDIQKRQVEAEIHTPPMA